MVTCSRSSPAHMAAAASSRPHRHRGPVQSYQPASAGSSSDAMQCAGFTLLGSIEHYVNLELVSTEPTTS